MPFTLITGQFRVLGAAPDGDSVRFYPTVKKAFRRAGLNVRTNKGGGAQLRLDGVDTLETHYAPRVGGVGTLRQPAELGDAAAERLLEVLGFSGVRRDAREVVVAATPEVTDGYVLTRQADKYGRCVSFAFTGEPPADDLDDDVHLTAEQVVTSANVVMLSAGLAYPTYYRKLFGDLRDAMTTAVDKARADGAGVWPDDRTTKGFTVASLTTVTDDVVILPKLFRRLVDYLALNDDDASLDGLPDYLESQGDRLLVLSEGRFTGFDNTIEVSGQDVKLRYPPEDLVFEEK